MFGVRKFTLLWSAVAVVVVATCSQTIACWRRHRSNCCPQVVVYASCCSDGAVVPGPGGDDDGLTADDIKQLQAVGATDAEIAEYKNKGARHADLQTLLDLYKKEPLSADDIKKLKDAGASDEEIDGYKKKGASHDDLPKLLELYKKKEPLSADDIKKLTDAGATEKEIDEYKKQGAGHDDLPKLLELYKKESLRLPAQATLVVNLPADAKLSINDVKTLSLSDRRVFISPPLPAGKVFHYTLKAERVVDGIKQVVTETVTVRAGRDSAVTLDFAKSGVAQK